MTILKFEFAKILKNKSVWAAACVVLLSMFAIFYIYIFNSQLSGGASGELSGQASVERNLAFAEKYAGPLTDKKVKRIVTDYIDVYRDEQEKNQHSFDMFPYYTLATFVSSDQMIYDKMLTAIEEKKAFSIDQIKISSLKEVGIDTQQGVVKTGNFMTWNVLFGVMGLVFIPAALFVILSCSLLFASDRSKNLVPLLFSTKFGRTKMTRSKLIVGTSLAALTFGVVQLILLGVFRFYYGFSGWEVSVQGNLSWKLFDFPLQWNNLQVYLFTLAFQLIGLLFIAGVTMLVSSFVSSSFSALAISLGLFFLPQPLTYLFKTGWLAKVLYFFPINTSNVKKLLSSMSNPDWFFLSNFLSNVGLIMVTLLLIKIIFDLFIYFRMKNYRLS